VASLTPRQAATLEPRGITAVWSNKKEYIEYKSIGGVACKYGL
jgi:hypothetical protein